MASFWDSYIKSRMAEDPTMQYGQTGTWAENIAEKNAAQPYWKQFTFNADGSVSGPKMLATANDATGVPGAHGSTAATKAIYAYDPNVRYTPPPVNGAAQPNPYTLGNWISLSKNVDYAPPPNSNVTVDPVDTRLPSLATSAIIPNLATPATPAANSGIRFPGSLSGLRSAGASLYSTLAGLGRNGDTDLVHVTPEEKTKLKKWGGSGTVNPITGLQEFFPEDNAEYDTLYKQVQAKGGHFSYNPENAQILQNYLTGINKGVSHDQNGQLTWATTQDDEGLYSGPSQFYTKGPLKNYTTDVKDVEYFGDNMKRIYYDDGTSEVAQIDMGDTFLDKAFPWIVKGGMTLMAGYGALVEAGAIGAAEAAAAVSEGVASGALTAAETAELAGLGLSTTGVGGTLTAGEIAALEAAGISTAGLSAGMQITPDVAAELNALQLSTTGVNGTLTPGELSALTTAGVSTTGIPLNLTGAPTGNPWNPGGTFNPSVPATNGTTPNGSGVPPGVKESPSFLSSLLGKSGGYLIPTLASLGGSLLTADANRSATNTAADAYTSATDKALALQKEMYEKGLALNKPFYDAGLSSLPMLVSAVTGKPYQGVTYNYTESPVATEAIRRGGITLMRSLGARGLAGSGGASTKLANLTSGIYADDYDKQISRLSGLVGLGTSGANALTNLGTNYADRAANTTVAQGTNTANADLALGRNTASLYSGLGNIPFNLAYLNAISG